MSVDHLQVQVVDTIYNNQTWLYELLSGPTNDVYDALDDFNAALDNIVARGVWDNTKYSSLGASGLVSVTAGQYIWMSTKNYSGSADITFYSANVSLHRLL